MTIHPPSVPSLRFNFQPLPYRTEENMVRFVKEEEHKSIQP